MNADLSVSSFVPGDRRLDKVTRDAREGSLLDKLRDRIRAIVSTDERVLSLADIRAHLRVKLHSVVTLLLWRLVLPYTAVERAHWRKWMHSARALSTSMLRRPAVSKVIFIHELEDLILLPACFISIPFDLLRTLGKRRAGLNSLGVQPRDEFPYPPYYLHDFHNQPNGGLSIRSALSYEWQIRFLFLGTNKFMRQVAIDALPAGSDLEVLDLGCGTGAWIRQARALGHHHHYTGVDLSPNYLGVARLLRRAVNFVQANAEELPSDWTNRFDVVTSIWLFHELPAEVTRRVISEISRVLKPGGLFIFLDAKQRHDESDYDVSIANNFCAYFAEPYFNEWVALDLEACLSDAGLRQERRNVAHTSALIVGRKFDA